MEEDKNPQETDKQQNDEKKIIKKKRIARKVSTTHNKALTFRKESLLKTYNAHCRSKKVRKVDKVSKEDLSKITHEAFKVIRQHLIERDGGVMVSHFGYFSVFRSYQNLKYRIGPKKTDFLFTPQNNGLRVRIMYFPYKRDPLLRFWSMDFSFAEKIYQTIRTNILKGKKYKNYMFSLRKLLGDSIESPYRKFDFLNDTRYEYRHNSFEGSEGSK